MKSSKQSGRLLTVVFGLALVGCADGDRLDVRLDVASAPPASDAETTAEEEWLRKQQMVRKTLYGADGEIDSVYQTDPGAISTEAFALCQTLISNNSDPCRGTLQVDLRDLCVARTYLAASKAQGAPLVFPGAAGGTVVYDQIGEEAAVEFATIAAERARFALRDLITDFTTPDAWCRDANQNWIRTTQGDSVATVYAGAIGDAYELGVAAFERAVEATVNASDKLRSSSLSPSQATQRAISGSSLSRAAAAHLLVGGDPGVLGSTLTPLCSSPDLAPQARSALKLLRDAAVNPTLLSAPNVSELLDGTSADGSVADRLEQFYGLDLTGPIANHYDLTNTDFDVARKYMLEEMAAFSRSPNAKLPELESATYRRYAGTADDPRKLPVGAWTARAGYATRPAGWTLLNDWTIASSTNLREFIATSHGAFRNLLKTLSATTDTFGATGDDLVATRAEVLGGLATLTSSNEYRGVVALRIQNDNKLVARAYNFVGADRLRVVVGEDGLRCAVEGSVEGADCSDPETPTNYVGTARYPCADGEVSLSCLTPMRLTGTTNPVTYAPTTYPDLSFATMATNNGVTFSASVADALISNKTRLYVVKPKTATSPERPGHFELLAGMVIPSKVTNNLPELSTFVPIVPTVDARVDDVFAPSRKFCSIPETSCVGVTMDARLPLEDELTDDGDGVESSWEHYLALARQAADEAEFRAREYTASANAFRGAEGDQELREEEQKQQAEALLQQVQSLCGTAIDSRTLLTALSKRANGELGEMFTTVTPCPSGYVAVPGGCALDFTKILDRLPQSPDAERLRRCLVPDNEPFVTLGDRALCVTVSEDDPNVVCPPGFECPIRKKVDEYCPDLEELDDEMDMYEAKPLGYFVDDGSSVYGPCESFRRARTSPNQEDLTTLIRSNHFMSDSLKERIQEIRWNAKFGGFSSVLVNNVDAYTTGDIVHGANSLTWPCQPRADCTELTEDSFFCQAWNCEDTEDRGALNYRLLRAAVAANMALGLGIDGKVKGIFPTYPNFTDAYDSSGQNKTLIVGDPCLSVGQPNSDKPHFWVWDQGSNSVYQYSTSVDFLNESGAIPIKYCHARAGTAVYPSVPLPDGYASFERTDGTGKAWIGEGGEVFPSSPGQRFAFKSAWINLPLYDAASVTENLLGGLSLKPTTGPHWTLPVLQGSKLSSDLSVDGEHRAYHFTWYTPGDTTRSDYHLDYSGWDLTGRDLLDGLELICELGEKHLQPLPDNVQNSIEMMAVAEQNLRALARSVARSASMTVFAQVPRQAMDALRYESPAGASPALGGSLAQEVSNLRRGMIGTRRVLPIISDALYQLASEMRVFESQVQIAQDQGEVIDINATSSSLDRITDCVASIGNLGIDNPGQPAVMAATCMNSAMQVALAMKKAMLERKIVDETLEIQRQGFLQRVSGIAEGLQIASVDLSESYEMIDGAIAGIDRMRQEARVAISRALRVASYQSEKHVKYTDALGDIAAANQRQYDSALKNAKLMAFFAKRAIEQRLGVRLSEMRHPLPLVEEPASWEGELCTNIGSSEGNLPTQAGGFIGDYVNKLERFVESYRVEYNFHEGEDVAVISLRDDVLSVKAPCDQKGRNLLANAGQLEAGPWFATGCRTVTVNGAPHNSYNCISAVPSGEHALDGRMRPFNTAMGYSIQAGKGDASCPTTSCGYEPGAAIVQKVTLQPGAYRFSWYTKERNLNGGSYYSAAVLDAVSAGAPEITSVSFTAPAGTGWGRAIFDFTLGDGDGEEQPGEFEVGFTSSLGLTTTIAAPMLERLPANETVVVGTFQNTDSEGNIRLNACEDTDGRYFREKAWRRECVHVCDGGFSTNCTDGPEYCYRELSFGVSQRAIEHGKLFSYSGFARGNFNYRIDSVALNFVGSGVRDCEASESPSACYGGGFVPYSLEHNGPFHFRNHDNVDFRAYLFDGRIEHARGLAVERYLTNPLSSTDRELLTDYRRMELKGRPLDGNFLLRVWEEPGVDFNAIQDVQIVLDYRYWTRFE
jgi:hypothetical protein